MTTSIKKDYFSRFSPKFPRVQVCKTDLASPDEEMPLLTLLTLLRRDLRLLGQSCTSFSSSKSNVTADELIVDSLFRCLSPHTLNGP